VEVLIVAAIVGILAAIVIPEFQNYIQQAKEAAAKDNLRILRNTIELYAVQHNGIPPGYQNDDILNEPAYLFFVGQLTVSGEYMRDIAKNPFNEQRSVKVIGDLVAFPADPVQTDIYGWIYQPATKTIKLNWNGTDSNGIAYFDY
jgi:type II secretory pathway pseudopilin PulG